MTENSIYMIVVGIYVLVLAPDFIKLIRLIQKPTAGFDLNRYLRRVYLTVFVCGVVLLTISISFRVNIFNYHKPVPYDKIKEISLADFNGFKVPGQTLQGSNRFAFITTSIETELQEHSVSVISYFHPSRSYVYLKDLQNDDLLSHEIHHFHITEICARKIRKELSELTTMPDKMLLESIYEKHSVTKDSLQKVYDYETNHGLLLGKQKEWRGKIQDELVNLGTFQNSTVEF